MKGIEIPIEIYIYKENASDDLFGIFKTAFLSNNVENLKQLTDLKSNQIKKIIEILEKEDLKNMGQLSSFKGIGETTISKCFIYAMRPDIKNIQTNLF